MGPAPVQSRQVPGAGLRNARSHRGQVWKGSGGT